MGLTVQTNVASFVGCLIVKGVVVVNGIGCSRLIVPTWNFIERGGLLNHHVDWFGGGVGNRWLLGFQILSLLGLERIECRFNGIVGACSKV